MEFKIRIPLKLFIYKWLPQIFPKTLLTKKLTKDDVSKILINLDRARKEIY